MGKNIKMEQILKQIGKSPLSIQLSEKIKLILQGGFIEENGCLFLKKLYKKSVSNIFDSFIDKTGYECFVNHVHMEDYLSQEEASSTYVIAQTMIFIKSLRERLLEKYPKESFVIIGACDDDESCHVRFHKKRHGESWVDDDLEQYDEAVMVENVGNADVWL